MMTQKSILVTGGAGYLGSHCVLELLAQDHRVVVLDNLSSGSSRLLVGGLFVEGRVGDCDLLEQIFEHNSIDTVIHFAGSSNVGEAMAAPMACYANNIKETLVLLDAMVRHGVSRLIYSSSAAVYGDTGRIPAGETHACNPTNPVGASQLGMERLLADCDAAHGLKYVCLRHFNAVGAHPSGRIGEMHRPESHLVPAILTASLSGRPVSIFGADYDTPDGTCIRDYVHVCDLAQAHILSLKALRDGMDSAVFNLGSGIGHSVLEVVREVETVTGKPVRLIEGPRRPGDAAAVISQSQKIKAVLGWKPRFEVIGSMIPTALNWHKTLETRPADALPGAVHAGRRLNDMEACFSPRRCSAIGHC